MSAELKADLPFDQAQEGNAGCLVLLSGHSIYISLTEPSTHADDEYARAGVFDPKIVITTSRDPSSRLQQFSKVRASFV